MDRLALTTLIESALIFLNKKYLESNESIVKEFIDEYTRVLEASNSNSCDMSKVDISKISAFTRMYMETSSDYSQEFLHAMNKVENLIKENYN